MTLRPYYEHGGVTIYHGDTFAILPQLVGPFACCTDQPFGTGWATGGGKKQGEWNGRHVIPTWDVWRPEFVDLIPDCRAGAAFGPNSRLDDLVAKMPKPNSVVWWRKTNPRPNGPDREPIVVWPETDRGGAAEFAAYNGDTPLHPNQKPISLMVWLLGFLDSSLTVLDPFAGSGSTLRAAKNLGRPCIGIEANEAYCQIAAERCAQEVFAL